MYLFLTAEDVFRFFSAFFDCRQRAFQFRWRPKESFDFLLFTGESRRKQEISFKKYHLPALKVVLLIAVGIVHNESCYKDLRSHGMDLFNNSQTEIVIFMHTAKVDDQTFFGMMGAWRS